MPFDDYCVAATTAIAKIEEVLEQVWDRDERWNLELHVPP